jgi:hypothetical protein
VPEILQALSRTPAGSLDGQTIIDYTLRKRVFGGDVRHVFWVTAG